MKISIFAVGTRGDVQPCVALAKQLKNTLEVEIFTHKEFKELVETNGILFYELIGNPSNNWDNNEEKLNFKSQLENYWKTWLEIGIQLCKNSDAIIYTPLFFIGNHLAEKLNIPFFPIIFEPSILTDEFHSPYLMSSRNFPKRINRLTHKFAYYSFWLNIRGVINKLRKEVLNLPQAPIAGSYKKTALKETNYLCCFSQFLVKKPVDWSKNVLISGYWFLDNYNEFNPDDELKNYFENNRPIFFDFGSFSHPRLRKFVEIIFDDLNKTGEKLLIDPGKINLSEFPELKNAKIINNKVPHEYLLPKVKILITQAGIGTIHASLKAGTPVVSIPMFPAQYFWANKAYQIGAGAHPLKLQNIFPGQIKDSVDWILTESKIKTEILNISCSIKNETGIKNACSFIEKKLK
jgi:sterol 3beta-glucosyltransferase